MDAQERRQAIARRLERARSPVSATALAREFSVSRQIIVGDVFTYLEDSEDQEKIINALSDKELREVLDELYLDDTVDIIEDNSILVYRHRE